MTFFFFKQFINTKFLINKFLLFMRTLSMMLFCYPFSFSFFSLTSNASKTQIIFHFIQNKIKSHYCSSHPPSKQKIVSNTYNKLHCADVTKYRHESHDPSHPVTNGPPLLSSLCIVSEQLYSCCDNNYTINSCWVNSVVIVTTMSFPPFYLNQTHYNFFNFSLQVFVLKFRKHLW